MGGSWRISRKISLYKMVAGRWRRKSRPKKETTWKQKEKEEEAIMQQQ